MDVDGLAHLTSVEGDLSISGNPYLTALDGLANLTSVDGDVLIWWNSRLCKSDVNAFIAACTISGSVTANENGALASSTCF